VISKFVITANVVTGERFGVCIPSNFSNFAIKVYFINNFLSAFADSALRKCWQAILLLMVAFSQNNQSLCKPA